jgi:hypothetical protein
MIYRKFLTNEEDNMSKNYPLHEVAELTSVKQMLEKAVIEAGDKVAFMYKEGKNNA